jgi:hypothetical protein
LDDRVIVRILTARVPREKAGAFESVLRAQLPVMREHEGLVYLKLARQAHETYDDVLLFEEWRDAKALYGWVGQEIGKPRLLPGAEGLAEKVEVTHYEALDMDPDAIVASPAPDRPERIDPSSPAAATAGGSPAAGTRSNGGRA